MQAMTIRSVRVSPPIGGSEDTDDPHYAAPWMLRLALARLRARGRLAVSGRPRLGRGVRFDLGPGAVVALGDGCRIGDRCRFHVGAGAAVAVGPDARLGER